MAVSASAVRKAALALPGVTEATSYGTPAYRAAGKLMARHHQDGESLVVRVDLMDRDVMVATKPEVFFVTDHYVGYPWVLVRLSKVTPALLKDVLRQAWEVMRVEASVQRRPRIKRRR